MNKSTKKDALTVALILIIIVTIGYWLSRPASLIRHDDSRLDITVGYVKNPTAPIELFGSDTGRDLELKKCTEGQAVCFQIPSTVMVNNSFFVEGINDCNREWGVAVNIDSTIGFKDGIAKKVKGRSRHSFIQEVTKNGKIRVKSSESPIFEVVEDQFLTYFLEDDVQALSDATAKLKAGISSRKVGRVIDDVFYRVYKKSDQKFEDEKTKMMNSSVDYDIDSMVNLYGFDDKGDMIKSADATVAADSVLRARFECRGVSANTNEQETLSLISFN